MKLFKICAAIISIGVLWIGFMLAAAYYHESDIVRNCTLYGEARSSSWTGYIKCSEMQEHKQ